MNGYTEQFVSMTDAQREIFEPMVNMNKFAVDAYEKLARHNYNLAGDLVDFSIEQARAAAAADNVNSLLQQQVSASQAFADLVGKRASEYSVMTRDMFTECQSAIQSNIVAPARRTGEKYSEASDEFHREARNSVQTKSNKPSKKTVSRKKSSKKVASKKKSSKKTAVRKKPAKKTAAKKISIRKKTARNVKPVKKSKSA